MRDPLNPLDPEAPDPVAHALPGNGVPELLRQPGRHLSIEIPRATVSNGRADPNARTRRHDGVLRVDGQLIECGTYPAPFIVLSQDGDDRQMFILGPGVRITEPPPVHPAYGGPSASFTGDMPPHPGLQ